MKIISAANLNHDSSVSIIESGKLISTVLAERITKTKHDRRILDYFFDKVKKEKENYDHISLSNFNWQIYDLLDELGIKIDLYERDHHFCHAHCGYYTSNFKDALCIVIDGNGSWHEKIGNIEENYIQSPNSRYVESHSAYLFKDKKINSVVYKEFFDSNVFVKSLNVERKSNMDHLKKYHNTFVKILEEPEGKWVTKITDTDFLSEVPSVGVFYEIMTLFLGYSSAHDGGKVMGLAQYKGHEDKLSEEYSDENWIKKVDIAHKVQKSTEKRIIKFIRECLDKTEEKNVILTGGVALNCVSNYNLLREFPDINFHIDPMCNDNGISIGRVLASYIEKSGKYPERVKNSYLGHKEDNIELMNRIKKSNLTYIEKITPSEVSDIIMNGEIVALFQGQSEVGQRSLGNRSFLFDPRVTDGKDIVNRIKKRETYRPFAASIMLEHCNDWFDLRSLKESPTMSFAVDAYQNAIEKVPAVIHADGTCRIQTVTEEQNYHFYKLIEEFYNRTGVPMLLNTSFNLGGEPLVETFDDALRVMNNSELNYIYLPEIEMLIKKS